MNKPDTRAYDTYLSSQFSQMHSLEHIEREYRLHARFFQRNYQRFLPDDRNARVLDVGCGLGHFLHFLRAAGYDRGEGIDLSPENVEVCRSRGLTVELAGLEDHLKEVEGAYSAIVLNDVLEHFPKSKTLEYLDLLRRALVPGGSLFVKVPNAQNPFLGPSSRYWDFTHEIIYTETSLTQVLRLAEFTEIRILGADIYVLRSNLLNYAAKAAAWILDNVLYLINWLYGRKGAHIFAKNLLAIARKPSAGS